MSLDDLAARQGQRAKNAAAEIQALMRELGLDEPASGSSAWMRKSLCAQSDPEAFFPEKGGSVRAVTAICDRCPVAQECLDFAIDNDIQHGIWGGLSTLARRRLHKRTA